MPVFSARPRPGPVLPGVQIADVAGGAYWLIITRLAEGKDVCLSSVLEMTDVQEQITAWPYPLAHRLVADWENSKEADNLLRQHLDSKLLEMPVKTQRGLKIQLLDDHEGGAIGEAPEFVFLSFENFPRKTKSRVVNV